MEPTRTSFVFHKKAFTPVKTEPQLCECFKDKQALQYWEEKLDLVLNTVIYVLTYIIAVVFVTDLGLTAVIVGEKVLCPDSINHPVTDTNSNNQERMQKE